MQQEILKYLNDNDREQEIDLLDFFIEKYPQEKPAIHRHILLTLRQLTDSKFIHFHSWHLNEKLGDSEDFIIPGLLTLKKLKGIVVQHNYSGMLAKITLEGKKEVRDFQFKKQVSKLNNLSMLNICVGISLAIIVAINTIGSCIQRKAELQDKTHKESIDSISKSKIFQIETANTKALFLILQNLTDTLKSNYKKREPFE